MPSFLSYISYKGKKYETGVSPPVAELYEPLTDLSGDYISTMLELGNKKSKSTRRIFKDDFERMGIVHTSIDWNGEDRALKLDLRKPLNLGKFDMVTNIGTTEHVDIQEPAWRNIHNSLKVGGIFISTTPYPKERYYIHHGIWYPQVSFFERFASLNDYIIDKLYVVGKTGARMVFCRMGKKSEKEFVMPEHNLIIKHHQIL